MTRILAVSITALLLGLLTVNVARRYQQTQIQPTTTVQQTLTDCSDSLTIREQRICVEVRDTDPERQMGLSGRDPLPENHGMLFIFPQPGRHTFWMKDMKFALDFLWIRDSRVVDITLDVPPPPPGTPLNELKVYGPDEPVDSVLEVNAGTVTVLDIATGDAVFRK